MSLTSKQKQGLEIAVERYKNGERYTTIAGFAGTGKTFLAKKIINALELSPLQYMVGAFTGKAAYRLQQTGFSAAQTLHKLRYKSIKINNNFIHQKLPIENYQGIKLILIDEISMVPEDLLKDIADLGIHIIMLGDPGQLPPVGADNGMLKNPHIFLDEIMRQEEGNSIIQLSKMIREGEIIKPFSDDFVKMVPKEEISVGMLLWADQVLCGRNATRKLYNDEIRLAKGFVSPTPQEGDKIIVTNNNWDILNEEGFPLINGMLGEVNFSSGVFKSEKLMGNAMGKDIEIARVRFVPEFGGGEFSIKYDMLPFIKENQKSYIVNQFAKGDARINYIDYGYCITTHKSQGSEYSKVLGIEERLNGKNHRKWLYTMVTRASEKLVLAYDKNSGIWEK